MFSTSSINILGCVLLSLGPDSLANLWAFSPQVWERSNLIGFYQPQLILPAFPPGLCVSLISSHSAQSPNIGRRILKTPPTTLRLLPVIPGCQSRLSKLHYLARNEERALLPSYFSSFRPRSPSLTLHVLKECNFQDETSLTKFLFSSSSLLRTFKKLSPCHYYANPLLCTGPGDFSQNDFISQSPAAPINSSSSQGMAWLPLVPLSLLFNLNKNVTSPYMGSVSLSIHISGRAESLLSWSPLTPVSLLFTQRLFTA